MRPSLLLIMLLPGATTVAMAGDFELCAAISSDTERLACYDAAAGRVVATEEQSAVALKPAPPVSTPAEPAALPPVPTRPAAPATTPRPQPVATNNAANDNFGLENVGLKKGESIRSRYEGEFTGWSGRTLFKLANGQVWRQAETGRFRTRLDEPYVIIERGAFNSYRLRVEGMNRAVRVKRIR